jgi:hypothetical protein
MFIAEDKDLAKKPGRKKHIPSLGTEPLSPLKPMPPVKQLENNPFDFDYTDYVHTGECRVYIAACVIYGINPSHPGVISVSPSDYRDVKLPEEIKELTHVLCCASYLGSNQWKPWWMWNHDIFYYINKALKIKKYQIMIIDNTELMNAIREAYLILLDEDKKKFSSDYLYLHREIVKLIPPASVADTLSNEIPSGVKKPVGFHTASELGKKGAEKRHENEKKEQEKVKEKFNTFPKETLLPEKMKQIMQWVSDNKIHNPISGKPFTKRIIRSWVDPLVPTDQKKRGRPKISSR